MGVVNTYFKQILKSARSIKTSWFWWANHEASNCLFEGRQLITIWDNDGCGAIDRISEVVHDLWVSLKLTYTRLMQPTKKSWRQKSKMQSDDLSLKNRSVLFLELLWMELYDLHLIWTQWFYNHLLFNSSYTARKTQKPWEIVFLLPCLNFVVASFFLARRRSPCFTLILLYTI